MTSLYSVLIGIVRQDSCCSIDFHLRVLDVHWLGHALTVLAAFKTMTVLHIAGWYVYMQRQQSCSTLARMWHCRPASILGWLLTNKHQFFRAL